MNAAILKKAILVLLILLVVSPAVKAQKNRFTSTFFGFSIDTPVHWVRVDTAMSIHNLDRYSFTDEQFEKMLKAERGNIAVLNLSKRNLGEGGSGIIPTIKISVQHTQATSLRALAFDMKQGTDRTLSSFKNVVYDLPFTTYTLNGVRGLKAIISFSLPYGERELHVRTRLYLFLRGDYFVQFAMSDTGNEDESDEFNLMAESLRFQ